MGEREGESKRESEREKEGEKGRKREKGREKQTQMCVKGRERCVLREGKEGKGENVFAEREKGW